MTEEEMSKLRHYSREITEAIEKWSKYCQASIYLLDWLHDSVSRVSPVTIEYGNIRHSVQKEEMPFVIKLFQEEAEALDRRRMELEKKYHEVFSAKGNA